MLRKQTAELLFWPAVVCMADRVGRPDLAGVAMKWASIHFRDGMDQVEWGRAERRAMETAGRMLGAPV